MSEIINVLSWSWERGNPVSPKDNAEAIDGCAILETTSRPTAPNMVGTLVHYSP